MTQDRDKRAPLHYAALNNNEALVRQLIAEGADINARDREGFAPLHFAAQQSAVAAARALLEAGAIVDTANNHGNTPLWTATYNSDGQGDMIRLLREAGADPLHQNMHGVSPLQLARMIANYDVKQHFADLPELPSSEDSRSSE